MTTRQVRRRVLYRSGRVHAADGSPATAVLAEGETIAWVGRADEAGAPDPGEADEVVDLGGAWLAPAFVDAHVHATSTGLALDGLDLAAATDLASALDALAAQAARTTGVVMGTGWDETRWPQRRPPTAAELERAAPGRLVYLARVDVHSAVVSPALATSVPGLVGLDGYRTDGWLRREAHHAVRRAAYALVTPAQRQAAQRRTRRRASELGIGAIHELAGPAISGADDCAALLAMAAAEPGPDVLAYWGELDGVDEAVRLGTLGAAGDLFVDGAVGSRTAALLEPYADDPGNRGAMYHDVEQVARHVVACTEAGVQAGFHAIGDAAVAMVLDGFRVAAERVGLDAVRTARHRLEHVEMLPDPAPLARYGIVASVQPAFDAAWGGDDGMYVTRLGPQRGPSLNPYAAMVAAGVTLAFGSDAPVTPLDPWGTLRAAVRHRTPASAVDHATAFAAHTVGGWRAARVDDAGVIAPGARATFAVWDGAQLDPRTGLPDLDAPEPVCVRTVVDGRRV